MSWGTQPKPKQCNNGCGQEIVWNNSQGFFIETNSGERHRCPNYRPSQQQQQPRQQQQPSQQQQQQQAELGLLTKFLQDWRTKEEERTRTTQEYLMGISWMLQKLLKHFNLETAPPEPEDDI